MNNNIPLEPNASSEPETSYQKTISTSASFEEMNEADAKAMANISPEQHLQNATSLIKRVYAEELKKPMNKRINFK